MSFVKPLIVGARVRLKKNSSPPSLGAGEDATVMRIDPRGVLLKFDSGRELLVEPAMLDAIN